MPSPTCTAFLTDHHTLKLATFVDPTEARNVAGSGPDPSDPDRPNPPVTEPPTDGVAPSRLMVPAIRPAVGARRTGRGRPGRSRGPGLDGSGGRNSRPRIDIDQGGWPVPVSRRARPGTSAGSEIRR